MHVVITGANRGLGLALVEAFVARGDSVSAGCRNPAGAADLRSLTSHVHALDLESEQSIGDFVAAVGAGVSGPVDVLLNNAGLDATAFGVARNDADVMSLPVDNFMRQIAVNTVGPMLLARGFHAALAQSDHGKIVNVSSQVGSMVVGARMGRDVGYATSKAALNMITVKLAVRLKEDGISAVALHPGYLRTDMGGAAADLDPSDAARQIVSLIDGLTISDTGKFFRWDGTEHPW